MEWTSFYDLCKGAVIDKIALQGSQKLQKSSLKGAAEKLLFSKPVIDPNFDVVMEILTDTKTKELLFERIFIQLFHRSLTTPRT